MAWYWPELHTLKRATIATRVGACVCFAAAVFDAVFVAKALYLRTMAGIDTSVVEVLRLNAKLTLPLLGCVLFTIAGWRIWHFSKTWAVIVLAWYFIQTVRTLGILLGLFFPPSLAIALVLMTAVRGTFAYRWLTEMHARTETAVSV